MAWIWFGAAYYMGALLTLRQVVLYVQELREQRVGTSKRNGWWNQEEAWVVLLAVPFWIVFALGWLSWKLIFPKGIRTRQAKEQAKKREAAQAQAAMEENLRQAERIIRDYAMPRTVAEECFDGACEQVYRDRGNPWTIGLSVFEDGEDITQLRTPRKDLTRVWGGGLSQRVPARIRT